jgi:hypothetical protein
MKVRLAFSLIGVVTLLGCREVEERQQKEPEFQQHLTKPARAECLRSGGTVEKVGMAQAEACIHLFADREKICTDNDDCLGECRFHDDTRPVAPNDTPQSLNEPPLLSQVKGKCQWSDSDFGCRSTIERGWLQDWICVD